MLSARDETVLTAIKEAKRENVSPSVRELCRRAGVSSPSAVHASLRRLEAEGLISLSRTGTRAAARGITLCEPDGKITVSVPLVAVFDPLKSTAAPPERFVPFRLKKEDAENAVAFPVPDDAGDLKKGDTAVFLRASSCPARLPAALSVGGRLTAGFIEERPEGTFVSFAGKTVLLGGAEDVTVVGRIVGFTRNFT